MLEVAAERRQLAFDVLLCGERRRCRFGVGFYGDVPLKGNVGRTMRELEMKKEKCSQNASILE